MLTMVYLCVKIINKAHAGECDLRLQRVLYSLTYDVICGTDGQEIREIQYDSRRVKKGDLFVCLKGFRTNGHLFIDRALDKGASAIVIQNDERKALEAKKMWADQSLTVISVSDTRYALAYMAAAYYDYPFRKLRTIGITGTKGKTTTSYMIRAGLMESGHKTGLIGTIGIHTGKRQIKSKNTTPESLEVHRMMNEMVEAGCDSVVMEVSSQALKMSRVEGILFDIAIFTNFGEDHIGPGEHRDRREYLQCKKRLFSQCIVGIGNVDDKCYEEIVGDSECEKITYGFGENADYMAGQVEKTWINGMPSVSFVLRRDRSLLEKEKAPGIEELKIDLSMPGEFNVMNALAATAALQKLKITDEVIIRAMRQMIVPGRMECVDAFPDCKVYIDYAHNEMSLTESLKILRAYCHGRLIVLFGCGGNRPRERRFGMGKTAGIYADYAIITTDNPRFESPQSILDDIECGIRQTAGKYIIIEDRERAVEYALKNHLPGDVILIAGKGHETYQEIGGIKIPMDDRKLVRKCTQILS